MFVVLGVNALAFRFADFLKDDLFRHLGRYASKTDSQFLEFDFFLYLSLGLYRTSFLERDFADGIRDGIDDFANGIDIDFAGLRIDAASQFFIRFEILARGYNDRVLDRVNHDLRIDSLFSADLIDRLKKNVRH